MSTLTIKPFYDMWAQYNRRLSEVIRAMSPEELAIRPSPDRWPIWATVGHTAGTRPYWVCDVIGEPGGETTPFPAGGELGWEDDLDHPRGADELVDALASTWRLIDGCLDRWTTDMLADEILRDYDGVRQVHSRGSILQRLFTHDAYHCGELSQTLGIHGLPQIDLWRPE